MQRIRRHQRRRANLVSRALECSTCLREFVLDNYSKPNPIRFPVFQVAFPSFCLLPPILLWVQLGSTGPATSAALAVEEPNAEQDGSLPLIMHLR